MFSAIEPEVHAQIDGCLPQAVRQHQRFGVIQNGWVVYQPDDASAPPRWHDGAALIHSHPALPSQLKVAARLSDRSAAYIAYNGNGRNRTHASASARQWGSWQFSLHEHVRLVRITLAGRVRMCNPTDDSSCSFSEMTETADNP